MPESARKEIAIKTLKLAETIEPRFPELYAHVTKGLGNCESHLKLET